MIKRVFLNEEWRNSWKYSYPYDLEEIYGQITNFGYAYAYENRKRHIISMISEVLRPGSAILDIAAAQGNFSLQLAELGFRVTWNDLREELISYVQMKHESGFIEYAPGNAFELEFKGRFDGVLIAEVIEHVAHPDDFLCKVAKLVRPGGFIVMTTPNGKYFRNKLPKFSDCPDPSVFEDLQFGPNSDSHIFLLHEEEVRDFARKAGLTVDKLSLFTNPLTNGHIKLEKVLKVMPKQWVFALEGLTQALPKFITNKFLTHMSVRFQANQADDI